MNLLDVVREVRRHLEENGRLSLRMLRRQFELDDDTLAEVIEELVDVQRVARREDGALAWAAASPRAGVPPPTAGVSLSPSEATPAPGRAPRSYTPKHLADKILQSRSALEGERKQVTVLFADVQGSMELAAQLDPEAWHRILERFFEILTDGVHRFEGTVNQYTGDGIMALFGAPIAHEDHAQRACYAALRLLDEIARYGTEVEREHGVGFSTRLGLNSGEVVVGTIGDDLRMDYTAQGHTVGLAQRMEALASPDSCYLTAATAALAGGYFALEDLGELQVKGVATPVRVHRLAGIGTARTHFDLARVRGLSRFVGRAADLRTLEDALEQTAAGNGQVVGVVAEAGTGKSRLCFEFLEHCRARGMRVYEGRAVAHGRNIPFLPILELFRAYFGITTEDDDRSAREKIAERIMALDASFAEALPLLFDFLGVGDPERPAPQLQPEARQRQLIGVMRHVVRSVSEGQPMVTLVEDLHWLDAASAEFLEHMVDARAGSRSLLLVNFRPEYRAEWMQKSWYRQIPLTPLGREAIAELLADLLGNDASLAGLAGPIHARTGGNPFFTEEVAQTLIESGHLEGTRGTYRLVTPIERLEVPATVQAVLAARIDRLPEREKRLLQVASVIGKDFPERLLAAVAELPAGELQATLAALRRAEFIHEQALYPVAEYAFKHPLTQEVALRSLLKERRRPVHAAVARAIEQHDADRLDERAALLAHHWEEAGEALDAASWHARAAGWVNRTDPREAHRHWQRVRELTADQPAAQAQELAGTALLELVNLGWRSGRPASETREFFDAARRYFEERGDLRSLCLLHSNYSFTGGLHSSERVARYREASRLARELGDTSLQIVVESGIYTGIMAGLLREASSWADGCIELIEACGAGAPALLYYDPHSWIHSARANARALLGDLAGAIADSDRGLELARDGGDYEHLLTHFTRSCLDRWRGDHAGALEHGRTGHEFAQKLGGPADRCIGAASFGLALGGLGKWAEALPLLDDARVARQEVEYFIMFPGFALALIHCGDPERALAVAHEDAAIGARTGAAFCELEFQIELAEVAARCGHPDEASTALARARELAEQTECRLLVPSIHEVAAVLAETLGEAEPRLEELRAAHRLYTELGATGHAARIARMPQEHGT